jgi:pyruvate,water dikinase
VWREDPEPVLRLAAQYRERDEEADPAITAQKRSFERIDAERTLLAAVPTWKRPAARATLALARRNVTMRGIGKSGFLMAFDLTRACARRVGVLLAEGGTLADPEDVFYLTAQEIEGSLPVAVRAVVEERRAERAEFELLQLPTTWRGEPQASEISATPTGEDIDKAVTGLGVSAGVVEGVVRVVTDPTFADVEDDEILVAPTTDPSWASILFLCKGLVVDIGGHLSHAAIVARELGIPCVVDTRDGSKRLRTGDIVRVDGRAGRIDVLKSTESQGD